MTKVLKSGLSRLKNFYQSASGAVSVEAIIMLPLVILLLGVLAMFVFPLTPTQHQTS